MATVTKPPILDETGKEIAAAIRSLVNGGANLSALEVYVADFVQDPPTITTGALDTLNRQIAFA